MTESDKALVQAALVRTLLLEQVMAAAKVALEDHGHMSKSMLALRDAVDAVEKLDD